MKYESLVKALDKVCVKALQDGTDPSVIVAALHSNHEAMRCIMHHALNRQIRMDIAGLSKEKKS